MAALISGSSPFFWFSLVTVILILGFLVLRYRMRFIPAWLSRFALLLLTLLALFSPQALTLAPPPAPLQIILVDQSDSLDETARTEARQLAGWWAANQPNRLIIGFAAEAQLIQQQADWQMLDGRATDLLKALQKAESLLAGAPAGRIIISTDGDWEMTPDISNLLKRLKTQGIQLETIPQPLRNQASDPALLPILAASAIWEGSILDVILPVSAAAGFDAGWVTFEVNGSRLEPAAVMQNYIIYRLPAQKAGITRLSAVLNAPQDAFSGNNQSFAAIWVYAAPNVLIVSNAASVSRQLNDMLATQGLITQTIKPANMPASLEGLSAYKLVVLQDVPAVDLSETQMQALQTYTRLGYGSLLFIGGRNAYTLGGYQNTLLEAMLPVRLTPPARAQRSPLMMLLVLDRSLSMGVLTADGSKPITLAKESAMRVIEALHPEDYLGVLTYSYSNIWHVPIRQLGDGLQLRQALDAVSEIAEDSVTNMYQALEDAIAAVQTLPPDAPADRYMLLLSDGKPTDGAREEMITLAQQAGKLNLVISTIALGKSADPDLMRAIAEAGNGRFYHVVDVSTLPRVMFAESQAISGQNIQQGETALILSESAHPVLSGMSLSQLPPLTAYNALSSKTEQGAEDILKSASFGDPVLSAWQYGLGKVAAWMGDSGESWLADWQDANTEARFWSQIMRYILPNPALSAVNSSVKVTAAEVIISASVPTSKSLPGNQYGVVFSYADAAQNINTYQLPQISADGFQLQLERPPEGAYRAVISITLPDGSQQEMPLPFVVNPPQEWLPASGGSINTLAEITSLTGFNQLLAADQQMEPPDGSINARIWLLLVCVLLWLADIAIRRRWLPWHGR